MDREVNRAALEQVIESDFLSANYVDEILDFRPWLMEL
jgi:hypothetical protein